VIDRLKSGVMRVVRGVVRRLPDRLRAPAGELLWRYGVMRLPNHRVTRRYVRRFGLSVRRGPFAGMELPREIVGRNPFLTAKLIGSYESELHPWLERVTAGPYRLVVDIGAADGYYVAGLARRMPHARVIAWEADPVQARLARLTAERNGVADRVDVRGLCRIEDLAGLNGDGPALVVIDAEGAEDELLDPERAPVLRDATVIVEVHEMFAPGVTERLRRRFAATHTFEQLIDGPRHRDDYPELYELQVDNLERDLAVTESRNAATPWLLIEPRATSAAASR
jgi:predicted O-methyltransferase YrrM